MARMVPVPHALEPTRRRMFLCQLCGSPLPVGHNIHVCMYAYHVYKAQSCKVFSMLHGSDSRRLELPVFIGIPYR